MVNLINWRLIMENKKIQRQEKKREFAEIEILKERPHLTHSSLYEYIIKYTDHQKVDVNEICEYFNCDKDKLRRNLPALKMCYGVILKL